MRKTSKKLKKNKNKNKEGIAGVNTVIYIY